MAGLKPCECEFPFKYTDPSGAIAVRGGGAPAGMVFPAALAHVPDGYEKLPVNPALSA